MDLIDAEKEDKKKKIQRAEQIHNEIAAIQKNPNFMNKSEIEKTIASLKNAFVQVFIIINFFVGLWSWSADQLHVHP
jgi:hypothetical protein